MNAATMVEVTVYVPAPLGKEGNEDFHRWLRNVVDVRFNRYIITTAKGVMRGITEDLIILTFITTTLDEYRDVIYCTRQYKIAFALNGVSVTRKEIEGVLSL